MVRGGIARVWRQFESLDAAAAWVSPTADRAERLIANRRIVGGDAEQMLELIAEEFEAGDYHRALPAAQTIASQLPAPIGIGDQHFDYLQAPYESYG